MKERWEDGELSDRKCQDCEYFNRNWKICDIAYDDSYGVWHCNKPLASLIDEIYRLKAELEAVKLKVAGEESAVQIKMIEKFLAEDENFKMNATEIAIQTSMIEAMATNTFMICKTYNIDCSLCEIGENYSCEDECIKKTINWYREQAEKEVGE